MRIDITLDSESLTQGMMEALAEVTMPMVKEGVTEKMFRAHLEPSIRQYFETRTKADLIKLFLRGAADELTQGFLRPSEDDGGVT